MPPRSFASFQPVTDARKDLPSHDILLSNFLSFLSIGTGSTTDQYRAAVRHFLYWLDAKSISIEHVNDCVLQNFERHVCACLKYSSSGDYKKSSISRVRRFVRFMEDSGYITITDMLDNFGELLSEYIEHVKRQRFSTGCIQAYRSEAEHFSAWMRINRLAWPDVDDAVIERYGHHDCRCPIFRKRGTLVPSGAKRRQRCARHFIAYLRHRQALAAAPEQPRCSDPNIAAFLGWLKQHRGATDSTIIRYRGEIERISKRWGDPSEWNAHTLRNAFERRAKETPKSARLIGTITRRYVRFLIGQGICSPKLLHAVPRIQQNRLSALPRYIDPDTVEKIVTSCGTQRPVEIRDKAIVLLLARLGLRASDIRNMCLDDIDWSSGRIRVAGKTRRPVNMPLPQDVGDAILAYLVSARPRVPETRVFLRSLAPFTPFRSAAEITGIVSRVLGRGAISGVPSGSHVFRHSLATNMLRAGAGLESVGTILRHSSQQSTAIYAKVNLPMLMKIAQPWPGE